MTIKEYYKTHEVNEIYESETDQIASISKEIELSKKIIEEQLPGKKIISFSYPFNEKGEIVDKLLRESGYRIVFGGLEKYSGFGSGDGKYRYFRRVSGDFVMRLPGEGRLSLLIIIMSKILRRMKRGPAY